MLDSRIKFDERYDSEEYETTTLYFIAPKEMLKNMMIKEYPEAISMEISIEFPMGHIEPRYADVCISPTMHIVEDGIDCYEEYDWYDIDLPYDEIEELIRLAERG
jgi:hypothetical protein